jgi:OFA family oxalate/formate antiporter-like MFS transporter
MLVTFVLGSVHAFSVFLAPLELQLGLPRSQISLIYSFALVAITLSVTLGYRIYASLPAWWLILITGAVAASGLLLAAAADSWWVLFTGYSLAFKYLCELYVYIMALRTVMEVSVSPVCH